MTFAEKWILPKDAQVQPGQTVDTTCGAAVDTKDILHVYAYRYDPEAAAPPRKDCYIIDRKRAGPMVLDVLMYLKDHVQTDLAFRRSCREGVCGSCAMNIDGRNGLACIQPLADRKSITLYPLPHQPVLKDLVPDLRHAYKQYAAIKPWMQRAKDVETSPLRTAPAGQPLRETHQSPTQRAQLEGLWECVLCFCCSAGCPSYWWNSDQFLGPATLLQAARWVTDSRDQATTKRLKDLEDPFALYRCHTIMNCTQVCPKGLNPARAIAGLKQKMLSLKGKK